MSIRVAKGIAFVMLLPIVLLPDQQVLFSVTR